MSVPGAAGTAQCLSIYLQVATINADVLNMLSVKLLGDCIQIQCDGVLTLEVCLFHCPKVQNIFYNIWDFGFSSSVEDKKEGCFLLLFSFVLGNFLVCCIQESPGPGIDPSWGNRHHLALFGGQLGKNTIFQVYQHDGFLQQELHLSQVGGA
jgi:hypothetical protein